MLSGHDQGQDWSDNVSHVYQNLKHNKCLTSRTACKPEALVTAELRTAGLLEAVRTLAPMRVRMRPTHRAA